MPGYQIAHGYWPCKKAEQSTELNYMEDEARGFGQHLEQSWEGAVGTLTSAHLKNSRINSEQTEGRKPAKIREIENKNKENRLLRQM